MTRDIDWTTEEICDSKFGRVLGPVSSGSSGGGENSISM